MKVTFAHSFHNYSLSISYVQHYASYSIQKLERDMWLLFSWSWHWRAEDKNNQKVKYIIINCNMKNGNWEGAEIENNKEESTTLDMVDQERKCWESIFPEAEAVNYGRFPWPEFLSLFLYSIVVPFSILDPHGLLERIWYPDLVNQGTPFYPGHSDGHMTQIRGRAVRLKSLPGPLDKKHLPFCLRIINEGLSLEQPGVVT